MNQLSLNEIKHIELGILKHFKAFCDENNIKYYLSNGTLLGAVKYGGFIPWDDDIDVFVPRDDYNKLMRLYNDSEKYVLFSFERNKKFRFPFAKLCDMTTRKEELNINNGVCLGVDIDIFPLDAWHSELGTAKVELEIFNRYLYFLNLVKLKKADSSDLIKRLIKTMIIVISNKIGLSSVVIKRIIAIATHHHNVNSEYLGCKVWAVYGEREIIPAKVFSDTIEVKFEGEIFPAPIGYDAYLRSLYGDYMLEPPLEKQKTHHNFKAYRL